MITPSQCRAARALLDWSQDELEQKSKVSKKTIAEFEREAQIPYDRTLRQMQLALEAAGVQFIPANGGGSGVRLRVAVPRLLRKRASRFDREASVAIHYRGREYQLRLSTDILDDIDRTNHQTEAEYEHSMDDHMNLILLTAAAAIDSERSTPDGVVVLTQTDFEDDVGPKKRKSSIRFDIGQCYVSKKPPHKRAEVVQIEDEGRKAWVDVRTMDNVLLDSAWVVHAQFIQHWSLT